VQFEGARSFEWHLSKVCSQCFAAIRGNCRGCNRQTVFRMEGTVGNASDMSELEKDVSAFGVDRSHNQLPAYNLLGE
jgi:hypothetical protein